MTEIDELQQAIAALETQRDVLGDRVVEAALAPLREKLAILEEQEQFSRQRRLVSVLFLDIVNSVRMTQGLEPEEVQEVLGGSFRRLSYPIDAHGGKVIQFMGDGFMAVFGLTAVRENDARQAVRAGLAILAEAQACALDLEQRYQISDFKVRLGINTGRVVPGSFSKAESPVMGLTVSLASRMEQAAQPGTLLISQFTYQHARGAFDVDQLPPVEAKGMAKPVIVYRVLAARPRTFQTFTRGVEGMDTALIGRETELKQLKALMKRSIRLQVSQLVTVVGEAGVGKSRLLYEFDRWIAHLPLRVMAFKARASPQMTSVPYGMLREMISYRLGLLTTDPVQLTRQRLVERLSVYISDEPEMKAHFIGSLLGFDFSGSPYLQGVAGDPRQMQQRARLYLTQCLSAIAGKSTMVILLDDLHWADNLSVSYLQQLLDDCPQLPLLVVCLARPVYGERFPEWGSTLAPIDQSLEAGAVINRKHQLDIGPLSRQASFTLLDEILCNVEDFPADLRERILDNADGNPFYLEEYIQSLVDTKVIHRDPGEERWKLNRARLGGLELPSTLAALLESRLDSLGTAQRTLIQQAAVIGRVFWHAALQAVRGELIVSDADLEILTRRGFIIPQENSTFAGTEEYRFHHALLRDAAYQVLVKPDRQQYHGRAAAWMITSTQASGRTGEFAPLIAGHYEAAGNQGLAADWYIQSGTHARNQGAPVQARLFFDHALAMLPTEPDSSRLPAELLRRWQALAGRDEVLGFLGETAQRMADDESLVALAKTLEDGHLEAEAWYRKGFYLGVQGQYLQEHDAHIQGLAAARRVADASREALILGLLAICEVRLGDMESATRTANEALASAARIDDEQVEARTLANVSTYYTEMGDMARAAQLLNRQLEIDQRTGNIGDEIVGLSNLGYAYIQLGVPEEGITALRRCITQAQAIGHQRTCLYGRINLALAHVRLGDHASALPELEQCLSKLQGMKDMFGYGVSLTYSALARELAGQVEQALAGFEQAGNALREIGTPGYLHDAVAGAARCMLKLKEHDSAERCAVSLWEYLREHAGAGMEFPVLAYETCADVFQAAGWSILARRAVGAGYGELILRAGRISVPEWRESFMERVPEHRRIRARWQEYSGTTQE